MTYKVLTWRERSDILVVPRGPALAKAGYVIMSQITIRSCQESTDNRQEPCFCWKYYQRAIRETCTYVFDYVCICSYCNCCWGWWILHYLQLIYLAQLAEWGGVTFFLPSNLQSKIPKEIYIASPGKTKSYKGDLGYHRHILDTWKRMQHNCDSALCYAKLWNICDYAICKYLWFSYLFFYVEPNFEILPVFVPSST